MKIIKLKKGDENMEHKDIWLVIGLTVILAVAVSVSTVSFTGNYMWNNWGKQLASTSGAGNTLAGGVSPGTVTNLQKICNCATRSDFKITEDSNHDEKAMYVGDSVNGYGNAYGKKVVLEAIGCDGKDSSVRISVNGMSATFKPSTPFHNNVQTLNGVTLKVDNVVCVRGSASGRSSAKVYITDSYTPDTTCR